MLLNFDFSLARKYHSAAQQIRVMSENWVLQNIYCVKCGYRQLAPFANNTPVGDFYCPSCKKNFELKTHKTDIKSKITDGAFSSMIDKIEKHTVPNFFYLHYAPADYRVQNFIVIPGYYFTRRIIEKRQPLAPTARRAGWVGCNINLRAIPESGKLYLIRKQQIADKSQILSSFNQMFFLHRHKEENKGWLLDIMKCIEKLNKRIFSLQDLYRFEPVLQEKHPCNRNIRPKIRQQLQILRDANYLAFIEKGLYQIL